MNDLNAIGLNAAKSKELAYQLNDLLSNYSIFYQNVRGYHWNIKGDDFFVLHQKFEDLYNNLFLKIDEVAERILTLGFKPNHNFTEYFKTAAILETNEVIDGQHSVDKVLESLGILLAKQRLILEISEEIEDTGTNSLMSDYIREQEKMVWMYSAYIKS
ncbi:Dps family protein [Flavobacterium sp. CSZ]|uniref:Dps family protein n=1 Tax=Flavobacterium sp. CSZ TaxID=2783791 RepID=UPI00188B84FD|nr:Dps family protein [Flavobacterium sp. CSZ]MBF4485056.1 DNA starvation/stationary phase protection protein [Flavobacterium sp. CSZ]